MWMAAGRYDADILKIRGAVWAESVSDLIESNPYRREARKPVKISRELSNRQHAENLALLRAMGPR